MKKIQVFLTLLCGGMLSVDLSLFCAGAQEQKESGSFFAFALGNTDLPEKENADRRAGDNAFAAGDYAVAVSFYKKYLEDSRKNALPGDVKKARVIDSEIFTLPICKEGDHNFFEPCCLKLTQTPLEYITKTLDMDKKDILDSLGESVRNYNSFFTSLLNHDDSSITAC